MMQKYIHFCSNCGSMITYDYDLKKMGFNVATCVRCNICGSLEQLTIKIPDFSIDPPLSLRFRKQENSK